MYVTCILSNFDTHVDTPPPVKCCLGGLRCVDLSQLNMSCGLLDTKGSDLEQPEDVGQAGTSSGALAGST